MRLTRLLTMGVLALGLAVTTSAHAADVHGVLQVVKGEVKVKSGRTGEVTKAKVGAKVFPKDSIITGKDARAKVVMIDNNVINVSPESNLEIQNYEYAPEQGKKDVLLNVIYGKVRSKVEQKYDGDTSKYQVKTGNAVAGVRGTDFMASYVPASSTSSVVTFEGTVAFGQLGDGGQIKNPVAVTPGKFTEVVGNNPPPPPQSLPPQQLAALDKESKAETAGTGGGPSERDPAGDGKDKKEKDKDKGGDGSDKGKDGDKGKDKSSVKDGADKGKGSDKSPAADGSDKNRGAGNDKGPRPGQGPALNAGGPGSTGAGGSANGPTPDGNLPSTQPRDRMPSSNGFPPPPPSGSMLLPTDFAGAPSSTSGPTMGPNLPMVPNLPPPVPKCEFCDRVIEKGTTNLNIRVRYGSP